MVCRLCLVTIPSGEEVSIFRTSNSDSDYDVVKMIARHLRLEIMQNDAISTTICLLCCKHLNDFNEFSMYVDKKQETLRNQLSAGMVADWESDQENVVLSSGSTSSPQDPLEVQLKCEPEDYNMNTERADLSNDENTAIDASSENVPGSYSMNPIQASKMVSFMEKYPDIIKGGPSKDDIDNLWKEMAAVLNNYGPPQKDIESWRESWHKWRNEIYFKLTENRKMAATRGYTEYILTQNEENLARICDLHKLQEGLSSGKCFALSESGFQMPDTYLTGSPPVESERKRKHEDNEENLNIGTNSLQKFSQIETKGFNNGSGGNFKCVANCVENICAALIERKEHLIQQHLEIEEAMEEKNRLRKLELERLSSKLNEVTRDEKPEEKK